MTKDCRVEMRQKQGTVDDVTKGEHVEDEQGRPKHSTLEETWDCPSSYNLIWKTLVREGSGRIYRANNDGVEQ